MLEISDSCEEAVQRYQLSEWDVRSIYATPDRRSTFPMGRGVVFIIAEKVLGRHRFLAIVSHRTKQDNPLLSIVLGVPDSIPAQETATETPRSVWGVHFPSFSEKETRLYPDDEVTSVVSETTGMELTDLTRFRYEREESLDQLIELARTPHYSTFRLYDEDEFEVALARFARNVEASYEDPERVPWQDKNTMYVITRTD